MSSPTKSVSAHESSNCRDQLCSSTAACGQLCYTVFTLGCARRDMNLYDNARGARVTDALLNYETVKVFGNEEYEWNALDECIVKYQDVEYKLMASLNGLNVLQSIIIFSGLIAGLMVCVKVGCSCTAPSWHPRILNLRLIPTDLLPAHGCLHSAHLKVISRCAYNTWRQN